MRIWICTFLLFLSPSIVYGNDTKSFNKIVDETINKLPASISKVLNHKEFQIELKELSDRSLFTDPCKNTGAIYGQASRNKILINKHLLSFISNDIRSKNDCLFNTFTKKLESTIAHELFHLTEKRIKNKIHNNLEFQFISFHKNKSNLNQSPRRSPDIYENKNIKEYAAVNFEFFIYDPEYKCRRPLLYEFYQKRYGHTPFKDYKCKINTSISYSDGKKLKKVDLTTNSVTEIHFLLASKGKALMSRFGHSMYKILQCPSGISISECRKDERYATVIGFLAPPEETSYSPLKGIFGDYSSRVIVTDYASIKSQYTRVELRDLISLPIKLSEKQKQRFLLHFLQSYWEYFGSYYFFTNNCADEALRLLQVALNQKKLYKKNVFTPIGMYKYLDKIGLIDKSLAIDNSEFKDSSFRPNLENTYKTLQESFPDTFKTIKTRRRKKQDRFVKEEYLGKIKNIYEYQKLPLVERERIISEVVNSNESNYDLLLDLLIIENQAHFHFKRKVTGRMKKVGEKEIFSSDQVNKLKELVQIRNNTKFAMNSQEKGYGIAMPQDFVADNNYKQEEIDNFYGLESEIKEMMKDIFKAEFRQIDLSKFQSRKIKIKLIELLKEAL